MTATESATVLPPVNIDLPVGWGHRDDCPPFALYAEPADWDGPFTPNLLVAVTAWSSSSFEEYLAEQWMAARATLADALLIDAEIDPDGGACTFLIAHAAQGRSLTCVQHHVRHPNEPWVVSAGATVADTDWPELAADLLGSTTSVRFAP